MTVELVIFDIGNVLIEWQPERYYDRVIGRARREAMFAEVDLHGMNDDIDRGGDFRDTIYAAADAYPQWRDEIRMWHDDWMDLATPPIDHSVRLLRALRAKGIQVQALTNFGIGTFALAATHYDFLNEFDKRHISGHLGTIKPDEEIYEIVERECGHAPGAILFTDDRHDNIETARSRGWQTHLFEGPGGWAERLVAEGLLSAEEAA
ncbi:2-haloacid dehalogenase [Aliiruegeria haliotis]|uniref:2-haloacid dehalogenase n=1 Tax=Aliiruegeria haliotis TaxID=1280846 RepID=A0A2T0RSJ0_9RHOB|nr:HAD family phosphatase [Aliiruegeria haliotis]PRY24165.1 2-haloacid dehalogenase [Aliiruegeria haliotis]